MSNKVPPSRGVFKTVTLAAGTVLVAAGLGDGYNDLLPHLEAVQVLLAGSGLLYVANSIAPNQNDRDQ